MYFIIDGFMVNCVILDVFVFKKLSIYIWIKCFVFESVVLNNIVYFWWFVWIDEAFLMVKNFKVNILIWKIIIYIVL